MAFEKVKQIIADRKPEDDEPEELLPFKGALRRAEARGADRYLGIPEDHVQFLNLPCYETGSVKKKPLSLSLIHI